MKKILIVLVIGALLALLYLNEMSKIAVGSADELLTLDDLELDAGGELWDLFYKVRATIIDGQSASFEMPSELKALEGKTISISGAAAFRSDGARVVDDDHVSIVCFDLMPLVSMTYGCDILPDVAMRWTVVVTLEKAWLLSRADMIDAEVSVRGRFRIDTSQPYNAAFFIEDASATLKSEE